MASSRRKQPWVFYGRYKYPHIGVLLTRVPFGANKPDIGTFSLGRITWIGLNGRH